MKKGPHRWRVVYSRRPYLLNEERCENPSCMWRRRAVMTRKSYRFDYRWDDGQVSTSWEREHRVPKCGSRIRVVR